MSSARAKSLVLTTNLKWVTSLGSTDYDKVSVQSSGDESNLLPQMPVRKRYMVSELSQIEFIVGQVFSHGNLKRSAEQTEVYVKHKDWRL